MSLAALHRDLRERGVGLHDKTTTWHQRVLGFLLLVLSLGRARGYMEHVVTTVGRRIYVPRSWGSWPREQRVEILRHELVHVAQFERWGVLPFLVAYLLLPLPVGLAWCRMRLEREAYEESIRCAFSRGGRGATDAMREQIVGHFLGAGYLWMWPFRDDVERWYDTFVESLDRG